MIQDFKFAFWQLIKSPGFTGIAVLTLALTIGTNSAIFALINGVIFRPVVPVRPAEVVDVFTALDPIAFATAPALLAVAALIATWIPARRATRVNPVVALRTE